MLLIIFLGLIVKLTSVSGDCNVGTQKVHNFDFTKFSGPRPWYLHMHTPNVIENNLDCPVLYYDRPEGNESLITVHAYLISENLYYTLYGNATNWNSTGLDQIFPPPSIWTGRYYVIAIDYNLYKILKHCPFESNQPYVYVSYRSPHPNNATVKMVMKELQKNNIDISQLVEFSTDHCQGTESSTE